MIEILQGVSQNYDFSLEISGAASGSPEVRFTVAHPAGHLLCFPTSVLDGGGYRVSFPCLTSMLPAGQHPCALEVVLGDRYFKPLFDTLSIQEPITATVTSVTQATPQPTVTASAMPISQPTVTAAPEASVYAEEKIIKPEPVKVAPKPSADSSLFDSLLKRRK